MTRPDLYFKISACNVEKGAKSAHGKNNQEAHSVFQGRDDGDGREEDVR